MAPGAVSLRKSHDIVILSFCNIVKGQTNYTIAGIFQEIRYSKDDSNQGPPVLSNYCRRR